MVLIVLIAVFLLVNIFDIVVVVLSLQKTSGGKVVIERLEYIRLITQYQRSSFSPAPMSAVSAPREMFYIWTPSLGCSPLYGKSSH
jgi:hypothetical protein